MNDPFGNFHKTLQNFDILLGLQIDIQNFIWHSKFQTDSFLQVALIFITTQHNFLKFGGIRIFKWLLVVRMWSFSFITHIDFTSHVDIINWIKFCATDVGNMKIVSRSRFNACSSLVKMSGYKKANWMSVFSSVLFPDFQQCLFLSVSLFFFWLGCCC